MTGRLAHRLLKALERGGRVQVDRDAVWRAYLGVDPEFAHSPRKRERLHACLEELVAASSIQLPATKRDFDRGSPPLPRFVRLVRARAQPAAASPTIRFPWCSSLAWAASERLSSRQFEELRAVHRFLVEGGERRPTVPSRERSLELFRDEKRLDALSRTSLFGPGRLSWDLLRCQPEPPPLVSRAVAPGTTLLVVENHHTYVSLSRALPGGGSVSWLAYGAGKAFVTSIASAVSLSSGTQPLERILYFGDLDEAGLQIPVDANQTAATLGLPTVEPAEALYSLLFESGEPAPVSRRVPSERAKSLAAWLGPTLCKPAEALLRDGRRLAQEWVGYERLVAEPREWLLSLGALRREGSTNES